MLSVEYDLELPVHTISFNESAKLGRWKRKAQALITTHNHIRGLPGIVTLTLLRRKIKLKSASSHVDYKSD